MTETTYQIDPEILGPLEQKIDALIGICAQLRQENQSLKAERRQLLLDRDHLGQSNLLAQSRIETMISQLSALNQQK
jgi:cell division protein ZapB